MDDAVQLPVLLEAIAFAARAHRHHLRKDGQTPYVSHVFRVCLIMQHVFGVEDADALTAAVLHDTIEDTTTDFDDLHERFGRRVAEWVALLSKDKRQIDEERERAYMDGLRRSCWQVRVCKLADIFDNLTDMVHTRPEQRRRTLERARRYLEALQAPWPEGTPDAGRQAFEHAFKIVSALHAERTSIGEP
jgi:guanosine-3',5'-bis(diphosphate) 3'-pyrophosphohydrolase